MSSKQKYSMSLILSTTFAFVCVCESEANKIDKQMVLEHFGQVEKEKIEIILKTSCKNSVSVIKYLEYIG